MKNRFKRTAERTYSEKMGKYETGGMKSSSTPSDKDKTKKKVRRATSAAAKRLAARNSTSYSGTIVRTGKEKVAKKKDRGYTIKEPSKPSKQKGRMPKGRR